MTASPAHPSNYYSNLILAICIFISLLLVDLYLLDKHIEDGANDATLIDMAGRQHFLTERIHRISHNLIHHEYENELQVKKTQLLSESVSDMIDADAVLATRSALMSEDIYRFYNSENGLSNQLDRYTSAALGIVKYLKKKPEVALDYFLEIEKQHPEVIRTAEQFLKLLGKHHEERVSDMQVVNQLLRLAEFMSIMAIILFVFVPMQKLIKKDRSTFENLTAARIEEIKAREIYLSNILENIHDCIATADEEGNILSFNKSASNKTGYKASDIIGKPFHLLFSERFSRYFENAINEYIVTMNGELLRFSNRIEGKRKNGKIFPIDIEINDIKFNESRIFILSFRDATDKVKRLTQVKRTNMFLDSVIDNLPVSVFVKEARNLTFVRVNNAFLTLTGLNDADEIVGKCDHDFFPAEQADFFNAKDREVLDSGKVLDISEEEIDTRNHGTRILHTIKVPVIMGNGSEKYLLGITEDITEEKRIKDELLEAKVTAEHASQAKSRFLANISHELRTPLNAIIGYGEILAEDAMLDGREAELQDLKKIILSGQHLLELINDVLDLSRIESGKTTLEPQKINLHELVSQVTDLIQPLIDKNGNRLRVDIEQEIGEIVNDKLRLKQVLFNLLSNAAKFTYNGDICISVAINNDVTGEECLSFQIIDSGIGVDQETLNNLFQPFIRASNVASKISGTGLGLSISRHFVRMMGGDITVESEVNKGSTFTLHVPREIKTDKPLLYETTSELNEVINNLAPATHEKGTVLIIDDDLSSSELLSDYLQYDGWQTVTAETGEQGIILARELKPDAITLDVLMQGLNGWNVLEILKADKEVADIPVIMCTIVDEAQRGLSLGAVDYMVKPIDRNKLRRSLANITNSKQRRPLIVEDDTHMS